VYYSRQTIQHLQALFISSKVLNWLSSGIIKGRIIGIYNNSFNIETYGGIIINIGNDTAYLTPKSLLVSAKDFKNIILPKIQLGSFVLGFNAALFICKANLCISVEEAIKYNPKKMVAIIILGDITFALMITMLAANGIMIFR